MNEEALSRFLELCAREMDASDVRAESRGTVQASAKVLVVPLGERSEVVVTFDEAPADIDARQRRLEMLATAFSAAIEGAGPERPKRVKRRSLRRELEALAIRADAIDAVVIDAHSPIVWGAVAGPVASPVTNVIPLNAESRARIERIQESHRDLIAVVDDTDDDDSDDERTSATPPPGTPSPLTARAVADIRALPATAQLHRGGHLAHNKREEHYGVVARSFAAIYVLILVFDKAFDMLRAERALREDLPVIERLVLALPPFDPEPAPRAGVIALRRPRRRR
ncbi:MAG TPA: hypothetical protein VH142_26785 [Polyangiaceae bacterium]|nr:hypothetical protein [Polyangiaceae bacterium]